MNRWGKSVLYAITLGAFGCNTAVDLSERPLFDNGVNVFEAQVIDGQTGTMIPDATINVQVGRHVLEARNDNGFYTVYGIPYGTFRVVVTAPGYANFYATKDFTDGNTNDSLADGDPMIYYFNNIIVYGEGSAPAPVTVSVYNAADGAAVPNATVVATLNTLGALISANDVLSPDVGILPSSLARTTDANGKATLEAASIVMGAKYLIDVFGALDATGVYLVPSDNHAVTVGDDVQEIIIFLDRPTLAPVALKANNEDGLVHTTLEVTFPYGIELCSENADHGWFNSTPGADDTDGDGVVTTPKATDPVTLTLSNNNTTITLGYATETDDAGDELYVTFTGVQVKPFGASDGSCTSLTSVGLRDTKAAPTSTVDTAIFARDIPGYP